MTRPVLPVLLCTYLLHFGSAFSIRASPKARTASPSSTTTLAASNNSYDTDRRSFAIASSSIIGSIAFGGGVPPSLAVDGDEEAATTSTTTTTVIDPNINLPKITQRVYLDVKVGNSKPGRIVIGLFGELMPKTVDNFIALCSNAEGGTSPSYAGSSFYRVISDMSIQGGAIGSPNGKTGKSAFGNGDSFPPDNYSLQHTRSGLVSAVRGVGGNIDSRFFIQIPDDAGWADDRYAAFGIVEREKVVGEGWELVKKINRVGVSPPQNSPKETVSIVGCGLL